MTKIISNLGKRGVRTKKGENNPARWGYGGTAGRPAPSSSYCYNLATWNVRGLHKEGKLAGIIQEMEEMKVSILGMAETYWKDSGEFITTIPNSDNKYKVIFSGGDKSRRGVALILDQVVAKSILYYNTHSERCIVIKMKGSTQNVLIIQIYAPNEDQDTTASMKFYDDLETIIKENKDHRDQLIIMGDFNAKVGSRSEGKTCGSFGLGTDRNNNGDILVEFCKKNQLVITNTWYEQKLNNRYTWTSPDGKTKNQIDFILTNHRYRNSVKNCKSRTGHYCESDHKPVVAKINSKLKKLKSKAVMKKWNTDILKEKNQNIQFKQKTEQKLKETITDTEDPNNTWKKIKQCLNEVAENIIGHSTQEKKQNWMTTEILNLMRRRSDLTKSKVSTVIQQQMKNLTIEIRNQCRKAKETYYEEKCKELEELDKVHSPKLFQKLKEMKGKPHKLTLGIKNSNGKLLYEQQDIDKRWEQYIGEELYNDYRPNKPKEVQNLDQITKITEEEVRKIIQEIQKNKSTGADNIPIEFIQQLDVQGIKIITELMNKIYETGQIPEDFLESIFIPLPKIQKATKCSDFRTISLIPHISKILMNIIKSRITPIIDRVLDETQFGFRKGRGTREAIFALRIISERMVEKKKKLYLCFIDYTKAFDRVNHVKLVEIMEKVGIPPHERRLIINIYWGQTARVRTKGSNETNSIEIKRGVRQGCILSPVLFNLYSEHIIKEALQDITGININGQNLTNLRFADDTVLLANTQKDLQKMVQQMCMVCKRYGMELNARKTKVMTINKIKTNEDQQLVIFAENEALERVEQYKYLGTWITDDGRCISEIKRRIAIAKDDFWKCKEFLRANLNIALKKKLLQTYIFSIVGYGAEDWTYNKDIEGKIRAFELWCYRRILKISWTEKMTNEKVLTLMGINENLLNRLKERKMKFAGHVLRGSSGKLLNLILEGYIEGVRDRGRQRRTWGDDVKEWSRTTTMGEAKRMAENRDEWRGHVANLRNGEGTA